MNLKTALALFGWSVLLTVIALLFAAKPLAAMGSYLDQIEQLAPASASSTPEPYGGCDEAWQAPDSEGAAWCRDQGLFAREGGRSITR